MPQIWAADEEPCTREDKADAWLRGVAGEGDDIKDLILQKLMGMDFSNA
jgi:hypothetical protein